MVHPGDSTAFILCVGISLSEATRVARSLRDRVVVLAAPDVTAARELLACEGAVHVRDLPAAAPTTEGALATRPSGPTGAEQPASARLRIAPARPVLQVGRLSIDLGVREATVGTTAVHLSPREFDVLVLLASDVHRVWSFAEITEQVWETAFLGDKEQLVSTIKRLRKRLNARTGLEVRSVPGFGYRLHVHPEAEPTT